MTPARTVGATLLQSGSTTARVATGAAEVFGLALLAAGLAAGVAVVYRWYARERVPSGLPILVGLSGVAVYLNSTTALRDVIGNTGDPLDASVALINIATVLVSLAAARGGAEVGDHIGTDVFDGSDVREVETDVSRIVQAVGRVITVELPEDIDDVVGYDPVPDETKATLAGRSFVFPRRLTVAELHDRLVTRLTADYAVGHVDMELADDGTVEYLALGSRASGIGPTLPPETSAVAIRADPAFAASAGDLVQVWRTNPMERVLTAELRGTVDDVVTLAVDAADTRKLADDAEYKLLTLPVETRPDREFASILRAADETMAAVTVAENSPLAGQPINALNVTVVAVRPPDGPVEALPATDRKLTAGDSVYVVAKPDAIRTLEGSGQSGAGAGSPGSQMPPDSRVDAATPVTDASESTGSSGSAGAVAGVSDASRPAETESTRSVPDESASATEEDEPSTSSATESAEDETTEDLLADDTVPGIQGLEPDETADEFEFADDGAEPADGAGETADGDETTESVEPDDTDGPVPGDEPDGGDDSATGDEADVDAEVAGAAEVDDAFERGESADSATEDDEPDSDLEDATDEDDAFDLGEPALTDLDADSSADDATESDDADDSDGEDGGDASDGDVDAAGGDDSDGEGDADGDDDADPLSEWETLDDSGPTRDDLGDLPGTDPDELTGANFDGPSDAASTDDDDADDASKGGSTDEE